MNKHKDIKIKDNKDGTVEVSNIHGFNLEKTLLSGQCFRFEQLGRVFTVQSEDKVVQVVQKDTDTVVLKSSIQEVTEYWIDYFGIEDDYSGIEGLIADNVFLLKAYSYSSGLKMMKQTPWETLVCFIISQRNNIPKIKSTVKKLCEKCGKSMKFDGVTYFAFPTPQELKCGLEKYGDSLSLGYRLQYLEEAANKVLKGTLKLDSLKHENCRYEQALTELEDLFGVGPKVANCVALFGLGYTEAFPVDVWIQRVIDTYFDGDLDISPFGEYAGIIQQFMFFYGKYLGR